MAPMSRQSARAWSNGLHEKYDIEHSTIQVEREPCEDAERLHR